MKGSSCEVVFYPNPIPILSLSLSPQLTVMRTTLRSMFNYPGEYVQLTSGVCSTTLGSMFNYPEEYVQLPWGVCSSTLGSIFKYPGECLWKCLLRECARICTLVSVMLLIQLHTLMSFDAWLTLGLKAQALTIYEHLATAKLQCQHLLALITCDWELIFSDT